MSIESTPASHSLAKAAQPAAGGKGKATPAVAGDALGFFAMLSAADDALALSAGASGLAEGSGERALSGAGPQGADDLLEADANALAGWVLGVPVPVEQEAVSSGGAPATASGGHFPGAGRPAWSVDAEAHANGVLSATPRKAGKTTATADLQKAQDGPAPAVPLGHDVAASKLFDEEMVRVQEIVSTLGLEVRESSAPSAAQVTMGERRLLEPAAAKAAPADVSYFQSQATSAPMGMDGVVAAQSSMPLEAYVAEQVTYWIAQDVQNAELTLDGMGFSPVEVSISMQGNEAQVAFRTDELHARDAIESASEQLKDALQRQGVLLTGMSVGTSHSGDASGQGRRPRQEGRQVVVTALAPVPVDSPVQTKIPQGRALDLFV